MLRLVHHQGIPEDQALQLRWDELVLQMDEPQVFFTYEWALAVSRAYGHVLHPLLFLAYEGECLVGVAALAVDSENRVSFLAGTTADYCDFICHPSAAGEFSAKVFEALRELGLSNVTLANLPADSPTASALKGAGRNHGYRFFARPAYLCAQIVFQEQGARESLHKQINGKQMLRRYLKAMEKIAPVTVEHVRSRDRLIDALSAFTKAHVARFLCTGRISNLVRSERRSFLEQLSKFLSESGWLKLSCLMVGDRPAAWNYGFQFAGTWFWYQPTFNEQFQHYSPGYCLLSKIVEEACDDHNIGIVDLGLGAEGYKDRFSNHARATLHVTLSNSLVSHTREIVRYRAGAVLAKSGKTDLWARKLRGQGSKLVQRLRREGPRAFARWLSQRALAKLWARSEVLFFQWVGDKTLLPNNNLRLVSINLDLLAEAAMQYEDDAETLAYLLRSVPRLKSTLIRGFALMDGHTVVHLAWLGDVEGFHMTELAHTLTAPLPGARLLFDCWTPLSARGRGFYSLAISKIAAQFWNTEGGIWIFSASENHSSLRGIEKAVGFEKRFSLTQSRRLFANKIVLRKLPVPKRPLESAPIAS